MDTEMKSRGHCTALPWVLVWGPALDTPAGPGVLLGAPPLSRSVCAGKFQGFGLEQGVEDGSPPAILLKCPFAG